MTKTNYESSLRSVQQQTRKVSASAKAAKEFLVKAKILTANGNVRKPYK